MLEDLESRFRSVFGRSPEVVARAPGRVNLIGEHTDYNEGLVLPCAIDRDTGVAAARRDGHAIVAVSREQPGECRFTLAESDRRGDWGDYLRGCVAVLREEGAEVAGCELAIASDVPVGSGLSSSAALELAVLTALDALFELGLDARERARLAHVAENRFVGVPCGRMDQLASALGRQGHALRIDCRDFSVEPVAFPSERARLLVVHSGVRRRLAAGGYAERRRECEAAVASARDLGLAPDVRALRDLAVEHLPALERVLPEVQFRRARHVITENARVEAACAALNEGDLEQLGALLRQGHRSLRDDFDVSVPELDALCEIADALPDVYGSRLTGAGFGGCTLHLVDPELVDAAIRQIQAGLERRFGHRPEAWAVATADGAARIR